MYCPELIFIEKGDVVLLRHLLDVGAKRETIHGHNYSDFVGHIL